MACKEVGGGKRSAAICEGGGRWQLESNSVIDLTLSPSLIILHDPPPLPNKSHDAHQQTTSWCSAGVPRLCQPISRRLQLRLVGRDHGSHTLHVLPSANMHEPRGGNAAVQLSGGGDADVHAAGGAVPVVGPVQHAVVRHRGRDVDAAVPDDARHDHLRPARRLPHVRRHCYC